MSVSIYQVFLAGIGLMFSLFISLYGRRILNELMGVRATLIEMQITSEQRLTRLEVKVDTLEGK